jgi:hypothetical protein
MNFGKLRSVLIVWLCWALIMVGYVAYVQGRFDVKRPDRAVNWTENETRPGSQNGKPYLLEKFMNGHVSWDSEYYLSIAVGGYDDPEMRAIAPDYNWFNPQVALQKDAPTGWVSMNYAFFPFYPLMIRLFMFPLAVFGLSKIATATLAGVIVSLLGALGGSVALYDLARDDDGEDGGLRAAFYLLIFPASMFLAVIYTEGLFVGLSFGALALARRRQWIWAALLAACATWTRAAGALVLLPMAWYWYKDDGLGKLFGSFSWKEIGKLLLIASPVWAYLVFNYTLGPKFHIVESNFFGRKLLAFGPSWQAWKDAFDWMMSNNMQGRTYYMVEFAAIVIAVAACIWMIRRDPGLALYGLVSILFSISSGGAQGMHRYVLAVPALFLLPARLGKHPAFDRAWTLVCILLMGVFSAMFAFDFWAG